MKRFLRFGVVSALVALAASECGGAGDDLGFDASPDQTSADAPSDVAAQDTGVDAPADAPADVTADAPADASSDVVVIDAPDDVVDAAPDAASVGCGSNAGCLITDYCEKGAGKCGGKGVCTPRPQICNQLFAPVCGCDKMTYTNECYAHKAGETVAYGGACE